MIAPDVDLTGPLRWHIRRANDEGTLPLVVRARPARGIVVQRAVRGEEPSPTERVRVERLLEQHRRSPLELPADVGGVRDYVIEVDTHGWVPPHRGPSSDPGYPTREAAEARLAQMRAGYQARRMTAPPMAVVARWRRVP